jgi:uncharacterized membrane protein YoaK (UPF0700 family)
MEARALPLGRDPRVRAAAFVLAAISGWLDGLTFVVLGTVFVSAVTGDLVQLGISVADSEWSGLLVLVAALAAFMAGTVLAVLLTRRAGGRAWPGPVHRPLLVHAAVLIVLGAIWTAIGDPQPRSGEAVLVAAVAALAAGVQGGVFLGLGIRGANAVTVTVVMMLLVAGLTERASGVAGPRSDLPLSELALIVAAYCASGLIVALALTGDAGLLAWVPAVLGLAVLAIVPFRPPARAPG